MKQATKISQRENIPSPIRAIVELHRNLGGIFNKRNKERSELWPASRNEIIEVQMAIAGFFVALDGFRAYADVLNEFSTALADLDRGTTHAILTKKGGRGKPPESTDITCARGRVAIAVSYMMRAEANKKSKEAIAKEIAKDYPVLKRLANERSDRAPNLGTSIVNWYDEFNKRKVKHQEARDLYRTFQHLLARARPKKTPADMIRDARSQLKLAAKFVPMTRDDMLGSRNYIEIKRFSKRSDRG